MLGKLSKLLECPICFNCLTYPVALCWENGHAICNNCRKSVPICPYCKSQWSPKRQILLEQLLQVLLQPCRFCHQFISLEMKDEHEKKQCKKKTMQCFMFSRVGRCHTRIPRELLWDHLFDKHGRAIWDMYLNETVTVPIKNVFATKNFSVMFNVAFSQRKKPDLHVLLRVFGDKQKKLLCFSVNIINVEDEDVGQFVFRFGIRRGNLVKCSFVGPCLPISCLPEIPDRLPGGHPNSRIEISKSNEIFFDPLEYLYNFTLKIRAP